MALEQVLRELETTTPQQYVAFFFFFLFFTSFSILLMPQYILINLHINIVIVKKKL